MSFYIKSASVFLKRWKDLWIHHSVFFLCEFKYFFLLFQKKKEPGRFMENPILC